jgi:hypothetical protein
MKKWLNTYFESGTSVTTQFKFFAKNYKAYLKSQLKVVGATVTKFSINHFFLSGFITLADGRLVYFTTPDVRYDTDGWYNRILYRNAKSITDFQGGMNRYTTLPELLYNVSIIGSF